MFLLYLAPLTTEIYTFPYTTLFRSRKFSRCRARHRDRRSRQVQHATGRSARVHGRTSRSEEHTSELQSRVDLVCRLVLEKKKARPGTTRWRQMFRSAPYCWMERAQR